MSINQTLNIKYILPTFFTKFPYDLYNSANCSGNYAYAGVGLGLINAQRFFWVSNTTLVLIYIHRDIPSKYVLYILCAFLYFSAFEQYRKVAKYLPLV
jgi:hypothetical protein